MLIGVKPVMISAESQRIFITVPVHEKLNLGRYFIAYLVDSSAHLRDISPKNMMWSGFMYTSLEVTEVVCHIPGDQWFLWCLPVGRITTQRFLTNYNPIEYL